MTLPLERRLPLLLLLACVAASAFLALAAPLAHADGIFVSAPGRVDHVLDDAGRILYISSGTQILRYDLASKAFLTPFAPAGAGQLVGMDLSPDGKTLVVADASWDSYRWIHLVDVATGASRRVLFPDAVGGEAGTFAVAYCADGQILVTTHYHGSGWTPLRRYDPATDVTTILGGTWELSDGAMLAPSADRTVVYWAETNISDGRWGRYLPADGSWLHRSGYTDGTSHFDEEIATNSDGSQCAILTYYGAYMYNGSFTHLTTIGQYAGPRPVGVAYHPTRPLVFFPWYGTTKVRAYETSSFTQVDEYDLGSNFNEWEPFGSGRAKVSASGRFLVCSVAGGVRYMAFNEPPSFVPSGGITVAEDSGTYEGAWATSMSPGPSWEASQVLAFTTASTRPSLFSLPPTLSADGTLSFTPAPDANGSAVVTVTLTDDTLEGGRPASHVETLAVIVTPRPDPPVARGDAVSAVEDVPLMIAASTLIGNDTDPDGDPLRLRVSALPGHGTLSLLGVGTLDDVPIGGILLYRPSPDFNGPDVFRYQALDALSSSSAADVTVTVAPVNDPPSFAKGPDVVVDEDSGGYRAAWATSITAGPNEHQALSFQTTSDAPALFAEGPSLGPDGVLSFSPAANANGSAILTARLMDDATAGGAPLSRTATFSITVAPVDDLPVPADDVSVTPEDLPLLVPAPGVLLNDSDIEGEVLSAEVATLPQHGVVTLSPDGSYAYTPDADFSGDDGFSYFVRDAHGRSTGSGSVVIAVTPVNDAPVSLPDVVQTGFQTTLTVAAPGLLENDHDIDRDALSATITVGPTHGSLCLAADGSFSYIPAHGYSGPDEFSYAADDGRTRSGQASVTVTVLPRPSTWYVEVAGPNRFATCAEASRRAFPSGVTTVVVATGRNWPDALGASALAGALHAPVLLVDTQSIPASISAEIDRLGVRDALVIGGETAVGRDVFDALRRRLPGSVRRLAGVDRYETSEKLASETVAALGPRFDGTAFVVTGASFPDALSVTPLAVAKGRPLFLVRRGDDYPIHTIAVMRKRGVTRAVILGSASAVSQLVEDTFVACLGPDAVERLGGSDRYDTSAKVAAYGLRSGLCADGLALAIGEDFPDALSAGTMQGNAGSPLLLSPRSALAPQIRESLQANRDDIRCLVYVGSIRALGTTLRDEVRKILD